MSNYEKQKQRKTASELASQAAKDPTKYDAWDLAKNFNSTLADELFESIKLHATQMENSDQDEFCVVQVVGTDPLIKNALRKKTYVWPWLPSPRPDQKVFLYNKKLNQITKRLWILPNAMTMAELAQSDLIVHKEYQTMRDWSVAFFKGTFWEFIRYQHNIKMLSQEEEINLAREELRKSGSDIPNSDGSQPFDFSKIQAGQFLDSPDSMPLQNAVS